MLDFSSELEPSDHSDESRSSPVRNIYTKIFVGGLNPITSNGKSYTCRVSLLYLTINSADKFNSNLRFLCIESMCNYFNQKYFNLYHHDAVLVSEVMKDKNQRKFLIFKVIIACLISD